MLQKLKRKTATRLFVIIKKKGIEVTFWQHDFKCNVQEHQFVYFYEVVINCFPNFMTFFYFPLALVYLTARKAYKGKSLFR